MADNFDMPTKPGRRILVIYNPHSGSRRSKLDPILRQLKVYGCNIQVVETTKRGDAEEFTAQCKSSDYDAVLAAGGDGTINEVVNGLQADSPPFGVLPLGTTNVFAREISLPHSPSKLSKIIALAPPRPLYVGRVGSRRFVQMVSIGFDAGVVHNVRPHLKKNMGRLAYCYEIIRSLLRNTPINYTVNCGVREETVGTIIISKGRYYAGNFILTPKANIWGNRFQICMCYGIKVSDILKFLLAFPLGYHTKLADVVVRDGHTIDILEPAGHPVQSDGDIVGQTPVRITTESSPLWVLAP